MNRRTPLLFLAAFLAIAFLSLMIAQAPRPSPISGGVAGGATAGAVLNNQANTYTTGLQDFSAVTTKLPNPFQTGSWTHTLGGNLTTTQAFTTSGTAPIIFAFPSSGTPTYTFPATSQSTWASLGANTFTGVQTWQDGSGNSIGANDATGKWLFFNQKATTGVTQLVCQDGAGQSSTPCFQVKNNAGSTGFSVTGAGAATFNALTLSGTAVISAAGANFFKNIAAQAGVNYQCTHGTNGTCGVGTLTAGTATISTTAIGALAAAGGAGYVVVLTPLTIASGDALSVGTVTASTSFVVNSKTGADAGTFYWEIKYVN